MGGRIIQKTTKHNDIGDNLCSRDDTPMQLFHFSFCILHSLVSMMTSLEQNGGEKRKKQYWRPDWKFPCWRLQLSPSCIPIPKHGRHSTLYICILYAHCEKEWTRFLPTQTSVASPQRNKSVMSSFWSSSFNMDSFWMQQRPLNVNTWLIKFRGKEFLISEFKKGYTCLRLSKKQEYASTKDSCPFKIVFAVTGTWDSMSFNGNMFLDDWTGLVSSGAEGSCCNLGCSCFVANLRTFEC